MEREVRRRQAEALDRYWDAVVSGSEQDASADVGERPPRSSGSCSHSARPQAWSRPGDGSGSN